MAEHMEVTPSTSTGCFEELASVQPSQQAREERLLTLRNKQRIGGQACRQKKKKIIKLTSELNAIEEEKQQVKAEIVDLSQKIPITPDSQE